MRVFLTGANGFLGSDLCEHMVAKGYVVLGAVRNRDKLFGCPNAVLIREMSANTDWSMFLGDCDVVIHLAARVHVMNDLSANALAEFRKVNVDVTLKLATDAQKAGVKRFVFVSSVKVNGERNERSYSELDATNPQDAYAISKYEAEQALMVLADKGRMEVVIIRPPLVYGPGVKGNFASMVRWVNKGWPLPLGAIHNQRSLVGIENLVDFITLCADRERSPQAANQVFLVSDGEDVSTTELLRKVAKAYGKRICLLPIPASWMRLAAKLLGKAAQADRLLGSLTVDISKAKTLLGWQPRVTMDQQLEKMAHHDTAA